MAKIKLLKTLSGTTLSLCMIILMAGALLCTVFSDIGLPRIYLIGAAFLLIASVLYIIARYILIEPSPVVKPYLDYDLELTWKDELIEEELKKAPSPSTIRILQTWIPNIQLFRPFIQNLLINENKQFRIEVLLLDKGLKSIDYNDLLNARMLLRSEDRQFAHNQIDDTIRQFRRMKDSVDRSWQDKFMGAQLQIEIRLYKFMPFGPIYQIGQTCLFAGFYISSESSVTAPMLIIRNPESRLWQIFEKNFNDGWKHESTEVLFPRRKKKNIKKLENRKKK